MICLSLLSIALLNANTITPYDVVLNLSEASHEECIAENGETVSSFCTSVKVPKSNDRYIVKHFRSTLDCGAQNCKTKVFFARGESDLAQFLFGGEKEVYLPPNSNIYVYKNEKIVFRLEIHAQLNSVAIWTGQFCRGENE